MKKAPAAYYPVFLDIRGKRCLVVGGGRVAQRKVISLLEAGADVKVISPEFCPEMNNLVETGKITAEKREFQSGDINGACLAISATDDNKINLKVAAEAGTMGIPINVVDDPRNSSFIVPSSLRRGDIVIAVSTSGRSPALARKIRTRLESEFGKEYGTLALLVDEVRTEIKSLSVKVDTDGWQKALDLDKLLDLLRKNEKEKARDILLDNLKSLKR